MAPGNCHSLPVNFGRVGLFICIYT